MKWRDRIKIRRLRVLIACEFSGIKKNRARSFPGIAKAMAEQWGILPPLR